MAITILMFISTFFEFDWYSHKKGVDVGAVIGLFLYLIIGVLIHYYVIIGVKKQLSRYLLPFICVYSIICITEVCMCLGLLYVFYIYRFSIWHYWRLGETFCGLTIMNTNVTNYSSFERARRAESNAESTWLDDFGQSYDLG